MLPYHRILIATDLSEYSAKILERAQKIASKGEQIELSIVHVIELSPVAYGGEFFIPVNVNIEQEVEAKARKELANLSEHYGISPKNQYVELGSVRVAIIELAEKLKTDLIVVGTHGHSGLSILLGSRANAILHYAKCDVLVVKI